MKLSPARLLPLPLLCALGLAAPRAFAQEAPAAPPQTVVAPTPQTVVAPTPQTVVTAPTGSPGVTVVAPTAGGGTVVAEGCRRVTVTGANTQVQPGAPCALAAPYYAPDPIAPPPRERYAPDPARRGALIAASVVYGVGATYTGLSALSAREHDRGSYLIAYGVISTAVPALPRMVVGDTGMAVLYAALRGASVAAGTMIDFGDGHNAWQGPFWLAFAAPVALATVDMATTPHREDLAPKGPAITGVNAAPIADRGGARGATVSVGGVF